MIVCAMEGEKPKYNTANPFVYPHIKEVRKDMKDKPTCAEQMIWDYLRNKKRATR